MGFWKTVGKGMIKAVKDAEERKRKMRRKGGDPIQRMQKKIEKIQRLDESLKQFGKQMSPSKDKIKVEREKPVETMKRESKISKLDSKFNIIISRIKKYFEVPPVINEEQFEKQLWQFLVSEFRRKAYDIKYQVSCRGGKIDIGIDGNEIGLELKIATKGNMQRLYGQVVQYVKDFQRIGIVIYDTGQIQPTELKDWIKDLNGIQNVKVLVKTGTLKGKRRKKKVVIYP